MTNGRDVGSSLTIAILAGGAGARLGGRDKGLHRLDGRPLIEWVIESVRGHNAAALMATTELLIVANRNLDRYARRATTISDAASPFQGPMAGVAAALQVCCTNWLLTVPVDCPQPPYSLADRLLATAMTGTFDAVIAHDGTRRQPLFALYRCNQPPRNLAASAAVAVATGDGVARWQLGLAVHDVDFSGQPAHFSNLNTAQDFLVYRKRVASATA